MEYVGLLSLCAAIVGVGLRCYISVKRENALQAEVQPHNARPTSAKAKRARQAALTRRLLRYHLGLSQA